MEAQDFLRILILTVTLGSLLAVGAAGAQTVQAAANGALSIVNLKIQPTPVVAGDNVTVIFQLYNSYSSSLSDVNLELTASNPIINVSPSSTVLIDGIGQGAYGGGQGLQSLVYNFKIPSTLNAGEYTIDVIANYQTSQPNSYGGTTELPAESIMPINIYVYGIPSLKLTSNLATALVPGQSTSLPVTVVNTGTDIASNVTVTLHNTPYFKVFGNQQFSLGSIAADGTSTFTASVQPSISINNGTYPINATISYTAQSGNHITVNTSLNLSTLINSPNIVASIVSANPTNLYSGGNQTLQIELQNTGLGTAKNITAKFLSGPGVDVGSISQFYISSLAPKNSTVESVSITANRSFTNSSFSLPVALRYATSNYGSNFSTVEYLPINLQKSAIFNITSVNGTLAAGDAYKALTFRIKNVGNEPASQVTLSLQTTFPITPVNPNIYIASLAPGQSTNATFYVGVDPTGNGGSYPVTVFEQWRQPNGAVSQEFSGSDGYYAQVGGSGSSGLESLLIPIVVVVIIIVAAVFIMRRRKASAAAKKKT
jgi:hypothetical protein